MPMMLVSLISHAQNLEVTITDQEGMPLENAVIELLLDEGERTSYMQPANSSIDQLDK